ncbi:hypothetical protein SteCoe_18473 [Stentor coeruleus]|uniref:Uncharacterized protein n=1 Tax=Stentor coeruleus TaxID=5963 RepID=A0A1R2BWB0_9CILI|nr:hypothetical protein SteCoe_18473 [Stentor coeruleus]
MSLHLQNQLRTRSQKVINTLKKELEKLSPRNASKSPSLLKLRPNLYKKKYFPEHQIKPNPNVKIHKSNDFINKPPIVKHLRDPDKFEIKRCTSKQGFMFMVESSPRYDEYKLMDLTENVEKCLKKETDNFVEKKSPILETANNIILSCNTIFESKERIDMPKRLKRHINQLNELGDFVNDCIEKSKRKIFEGLKILALKKKALENKKDI